MRLHLDPQTSEPIFWKEVLRLPDLSGNSSFEGCEVSEVRVEGTLERWGTSWKLQAKLNYTRTLPCDRCLEAVGEEVTSAFQWILLPARPMREGPAGGRRQDPQETPEGAGELLVECEEGCLEVRGEWIESEILVREQVLLDLPVQTLCHPECRGLCPECGERRALDGCRCRERAFDPRWTSLLALRGSGTPEPPRRGTR